jgi:heme oxygenase
MTSAFKPESLARSEAGGNKPRSRFGLEKSTTPHPENAPMDPLHDLRAATRPLHDRIEQLPVCRAMAAGTVGRDEVAFVTAALWHAYRAFERELARHDKVAAVWPTQEGRSAALERDLFALGADAGDEPEYVREWADALRERAQTDPEVWAGAVYVFEGSRMGSRVLLPALATALGVDARPGVGLDFHLEAVQDAGVWPALRKALPALGGTPAARSAMQAGAVATFELMIALHAAAEPAAV